MMAYSSSRPVLNVSNLHDFLNKLVNWKIFATHLRGLSDSELDKIAKDRSEVDDQKLLLCQRWLKQCPHPPPSWEDVVKALKKSGNLDVARDVENECGVKADTGFSTSVTEPETLDIDVDDSYGQPPMQSVSDKVSDQRKVNQPIPSTDDSNGHTTLPFSNSNGAVFDRIPVHQISMEVYSYEERSTTEFIAHHYKKIAIERRRVSEIYIQDIKGSYEKMLDSSDAVIEKLRKENSGLQEKVKEKDNVINMLKKQLELEDLKRACTCQRSTPRSVDSLSKGMEELGLSIK